MRSMVGFFMLGFILAGVLVMFLVDIGVIKANIFTETVWYGIVIIMGSGMIVYFLS